MQYQPNKYSSSNAEILALRVFERLKKTACKVLRRQDPYVSVSSALDKLFYLFLWLLVESLLEPLLYLRPKPTIIHMQ